MVDDGALDKTRSSSPPLLPFPHLPRNHDPGLEAYEPPLPFPPLPPQKRNTLNARAGLQHPKPGVDLVPGRGHPALGSQEVWLEVHGLSF